MDPRTHVIMTETMDLLRRRDARFFPPFPFFPFSVVSYFCFLFLFLISVSCFYFVLLNKFGSGFRFWGYEMKSLVWDLWGGYVVFLYIFGEEAKGAREKKFLLLFFYNSGLGFGFVKHLPPPSLLFKLILSQTHTPSHLLPHTLPYLLPYLSSPLHISSTSYPSIHHQPNPTSQIL